MSFIFPNTQYEARHIDGRNADVDAAEDIWAVGGDYPFPSAAATTTIVSDSANDTSNGTGARTVYVSGVNSSWMRTTETATMSGTNAVTLANQYLRINNAYVITVGTNEVNVGNIDVKHGSTVLARIPAGYGTISAAVYSIPADYHHATLIAWHAGMLRSTSAQADLQLMQRRYGESWRIEDHCQVSQTVIKNNPKYAPLILPARSDVKMRVAGVSAQNTDVFGGFYLMLWYTENTFYKRFDTATIL